MLNTKNFHASTVLLLTAALLLGLSACGGGGSEPLASNNNMNFQLNCVNGQSVPGTASTGCNPPTTNSGNGNQSSEILNINNAPFVGSVTVRAVDAVAAIGTLLQSVLPALISSATLPSCTTGDRQMPTTDTVEFSSCSLPVMPYAVNGTLTVDTTNGGSTNVELTGLGGNANFQLRNSSNALVTEIQTHGPALNAVVQLTTNPSITLSENTATTTPTIEIIKPGSPGEVYTLASGFNAVLTSDPGLGAPLSLTLAGGIEDVPTTGLAVTISAVPSLNWNGGLSTPTDGDITATATDGTSVTLSLDSASNVTISVTANGNNTGVCSPLDWSSLANGSAIASANCS